MATSKFNKLLPADSKARGFIVLGVILALIIGLYVLVTGDAEVDASASKSNVVKVPKRIDNVPGGELTQEYRRALVEANKANAREAEMSGESSVATMLNTSGFSGGPSSQCSPSCNDLGIDALIRMMLTNGEITPAVADELLELSANNVPVTQFSSTLTSMLKTNKIEPAQARLLLERYIRKFADAAMRAGAALIDQLIKSGDLPLDAGNLLLSMQKRGVSVAEYADELQRMVREGVITAETARKLLTQYRTQSAEEAAAEAAAQMNDLLSSGAISQQDAQALLAMQNRQVPVADYAAQLAQMVKDGKISPETAAKLLAQYKERNENSMTSEAQERIAAAEQLNSMIATGEISKADADGLMDLQNKGSSVLEYQAELDRLVREGKISPETAAKLLAQYRNVKGDSAGASAQAKLDALAKEGVRKMSLLSVEGRAALANKSAAQIEALVGQELENLSAASKNQMDEWVKSGKVTPEGAKALLALQDKEVSPEEYAAELDRLVREGKISPEMRDQMMAQYAKLHSDRDKARALSPKHQLDHLKNASKAQMDEWVKSGKVTPEGAKALLALQDKEVSPEEYAAELDRLVREGKISPEMRDQMMAQYQQLHGDREKAREAVLPKSLAALQDKDVSPDEYAAELDRLVREGKITPEMRDKLMSQYERIHEEKMKTTVSPEIAKSLLALQSKDVSPEDYKAELDRLVREGKLSPEMRDKLMADYKTLHEERSKILAQRSLSSMIDVGLPSIGELSLNRGQVKIATDDSGTSSLAGIPEEEMTGYQRLQARLERQSKEKAEREELKRQAALVASQPKQLNSQAVIQGTATNARQTAVNQEQEAIMKRRMALQAAMQTQAQQIYGSWNQMTPQEKMITIVDPAKEAAAAQAKADAAAAASSNGEEVIPPMIRSGDILFGVLDTGVNSDYPNQAVMVTIVQGKFKGARIIGTLAKGGPYSEELLLSFTSMSMLGWPATQTVSAMGIDPETAQQGMASDVDHYYFSRYATLFATSFLSGYADALTSAGEATINADGTAISTTTPNLSPQGRIMAGLGEVGAAMSGEAKKYFERDPTITIDAGIAIAVLFTADMIDPMVAYKQQQEDEAAAKAAADAAALAEEDDEGSVDINELLSGLK